MKLTLAQTKQILKDYNSYIDGGTASWIAAMEIIGQTLSVQNDICVLKLTPKEIQTKLNILLTDKQKENIAEIL